MTLVCPITNTKNRYPLHVPLDERTVTTGVVLCEQIRALDLSARPYVEIEMLPGDILETVIHIIEAEIELS